MEFTVSFVAIIIFGGFCTGLAVGMVIWAIQDAKHSRKARARAKALPPRLVRQVKNRRAIKARRFPKIK